MEGKRQGGPVEREEKGERRRAKPFSFPLSIRFLCLRRVVEQAALDDVLFIVRSPVAINIYFDGNLVLLTVAAVAGIVAEAVLVAEQRFDFTEHVWHFTFKGDGVVFAARLFGERVELILSL